MQSIESEHGMQIVAQCGPKQLVLKKVMLVSTHSETLRHDRTDANIYSFIVHVSNQYLLVLTDQGTVEVHK